MEDGIDLDAKHLRISPLSDRELQRVINTMVGESHRGCVLAGVALLEWKMREVLKKTFLKLHGESPSDKVLKDIDFMLDPNSDKSILGSAAARARMCKVCGIISEETHKLFKDLFVFRNHYFAHIYRDATLKSPSAKRALAKLNDQIPLSKLKVLKVFGKRIEEEHLQFMRIIIYSFIQLDEGVDQNHHTESQPTSS
jgi:hypothetical protein